MNFISFSVSFVNQYHNRMKTKQYNFTNAIGWIVVILAIPLFYFFYFFIYVPQQESQVQKRGFRILKEYGSNMIDKYEYYKKHLEIYDPYYKLLYYNTSDSKDSLTKIIKKIVAQSKPTQRIFSDLEKTIITDTIKEESDEFTKIKQDHSTENYYLEFSYEDGSFSDFLADIVIRDKVNLDKSDYAFLGIDRQSSKSVQQYKYKRADTKNYQVPEIQGPFDSNKWPEATFYHKVPIDKVMEGQKFDILLNNIVLFDSDRVIYNTSFDVVQDITNPRALSDSTLSNQGGVIEEIEVNGINNRVMILPINILGQKYFLAGFIPETDFNEKTRSVNSQFLIIMGGLLLLVIFGMPILKIIFINRRERLKASDATNVTISFILCTGLLVLILIGTMKHYVVDQYELKNRAVRVSDTLYRNFTADLDSLIDLYGRIVAPPPANIKDQVSELARQVNRNFISGTKFDTIPKSYLRKEIPINEILLIDSAGVVKNAVTRTAFSDILPINLSTRKYFTHVMDPKKSWPLKKIAKSVTHLSKKGSLGQGFYLESIKSYNTGYQEASISFRLPDENTNMYNAPVIAITSKIPSLYSQVLPKDISFMVVDETGDVLFHSQQLKNLHENFFDECNHNPDVLGAIGHRQSEIISVDYNEKSWLIRLVPVENTPLFHITLIDLEQTHNKNARIFLFTFYFLIITMLFVIIGMQIMQRLRRKKTFMPAMPWSLSWLLFQGNKYEAYKAMLFIQLVIALCQFTGLFNDGKPVTMLIYQLIFVCYSGFAALAVLGGKTDPFRNFFRLSYLSTSIIFSGTVILIVILSFLHSSIFLIPAFVLSWLSVIIYNMGHKNSGKGVFNIQSILGWFSKISTWVRSKFQKRSNGVPSKTVSLLFKSNVYHLYLFIWLGCQAALPVLQYYRTIKLQEQQIWNRDEREYVANQNLLLSQMYGISGECPWYERIMGNGIDFLKIEQMDTLEIEAAPVHMWVPDFIYSEIPDPVTRDQNFKGLLRDRSHHGEWVSENNVLDYSRAGIDGFIQVTTTGDYQMSLLTWILNFISPIILIALFIWFMYRFVSDNILNTMRVKWIRPRMKPWSELIRDKNTSRLLLISFNSHYYENQAREILDSDAPEPKHKSNLEILTMNDIQTWDEKIDKILKNENKLIWIVGLGSYLKLLSKSELIVPNLIKLVRLAKNKVVIELPYDLDYIDEYYEEHQNAQNLGKEEIKSINNLKSDLNVLFKDFYRFTASLLPESSEDSESEINVPPDEESIDEVKVLSDLHEKEPLYSYIWTNLCEMEKIVLYNLADDGIVNFKNKTLINRLRLKGLILLDPYPRLYDESFHYFLKFSIKPEEAKMLEHKLSKHGKWRNLRYLIILGVATLAGFVFIAQGSSIEKVIGVLTGLLAVVSGLMRLLDAKSAGQAVN